MSIPKLDKLVPTKGASYKIKNPYLATVTQHYELSKVDSADQTFHITLDIKNSGITYLEGQSIGVIPPGQRDDGRKLKARLYSISSARDGDNEGLLSLSLSVKRLVYQDSDQKDVFGTCSDFLCNSKKGDKIPIINATGRIMLLPASNQVDLILIGTGTGVAPFRGFLQHISQSPSKWLGKGFLYLGFKRQKEALYCNSYNQELIDLCQKAGFNLNLALSREEKNQSGSRLYVADKMLSDYEAIKSIIANKNFAVYVCGLKGMEESISDLFEKITTELGYDWPIFKKELRLAGRWNIEVY
ncbi:MAG: hypothetical protein JJV97_05650 [SAR324 cluster bacterium]|nr:hypothetical protein [SAR324 cluster bacterium]